jgi:hypothetical protein
MDFGARICPPLGWLVIFLTLALLWYLLWHL